MRFACFQSEPKSAPPATASSTRWLSASSGKQPSAADMGNRMGLQAQPQRFDYLQNSGKAGVALARKGLVQALPTQPGVLCQLRHALGSGNHSQRMRNECRIVANPITAGTLAFRN